MKSFTPHQTCMTVLAVLALWLPGSPAADTAASLYTEYCSVCHGDKGDGRSHAVQGLQPPPRDFTNPDTAHVLTQEYIVSSITHGKPGTAMAAWGSQLDQAQIEMLTDYIRSEFMQIDRVDLSSQPGKDDESFTDGKNIYSSSCSVCHGDNGQGAVWGRTSLNPPPVDFSRADPVRQLTRPRMLASVTQGRPGTAMTAFESQLSQAEIEAVVDFIRDTFMREQQPRATGAAVPQAIAASTVGMAVMHGMPAVTHAPMPAAAAIGPNASMPHDLNGNAESGMALYLANCSSCHGDRGNGDGPRAYFIFPKPRNLTLVESRMRLNRHVLYNAISQGVPGREMPAWSKVLDGQQIADIAEYVYQAFISSEAQASGIQTGGN